MDKHVAETQQVEAGIGGVRGPAGMVTAWQARCSCRWRGPARLSERGADLDGDYHEQTCNRWSDNRER